MSKNKKDYLAEYKKLGGEITKEVEAMKVAEIRGLIEKLGMAKGEKVDAKKCTHIDRSNGALLREKDLDKKKPWISPISGQATVEKLTDEELENL